VWLILTDNALRTLPPSLGRLPFLRKLMLASNALTSVPVLSGATGLELVRLADNRLGQEGGEEGAGLHPGAALFALPALSWLALAGNFWGPQPRVEGDEDPESATFPLAPALRVDASRLRLGALLGKGASGHVHAAALLDGAGGETAVAVKLFRGGSSDGRAVDEARLCLALAASPHPHVIHASAWATPLPIDGPGGFAPVLATVLPLHEGIRPLGLPPSFASVTRDEYGTGSFPASYVAHVLRAVASAAAHLHAHGISHSDLYAHNILVDGPESMGGGATGWSHHRVLLSDLGAAFAYDAREGGVGRALERMEVRAYGVLAEELLDRVAAPEAMVGLLRALASACLAADVCSRPSFEELVDALDALATTF
jgi:hypothetical protein